MFFITFNWTHPVPYLIHGKSFALSVIFIYLHVDLRNFVAKQLPRMRINSKKGNLPVIDGHELVVIALLLENFAYLQPQVLRANEKLRLPWDVFKCIKF